MSYDVVRVSRFGGSPKVVATFESRAAAEADRRAWERQAMKDFKEGRIAYDVPDYRVRRASAERDGRRPAARRDPAPPRTFRSPGGRTFSIAGHQHEEGRWGPEDRWTILFRGKPAGKLFRDQRYTGKPWHATTRELFWTHAPDAPTGVGFDVAAFSSVGDAITAWSRSADEILDWKLGRPVRTLYGTKQKARTTKQNMRRRGLLP